MTRTIETYKLVVANTFSFLKLTDKYDALLAKAIVLPNDEGYLVPVCELHSEDNRIIEMLSKWREENYFAYPSQFPVTNAGTASWLRSKLLDVKDRILFLVLDKNGRPVGHLGYASSINDQMEMEIDNVVRGEKETSPGIMGLAMDALLDWAQEMIGPKEVFLRVFSDNEHAVNFYRKLGFRNDILIPLRRHIEGESTFYRDLAEGDTASPDKSYLRMIYSPKRVVDGSQMILTAGPSISAREASYALDAARYGWNSQWSKYINKFEKTFADYIGVKYAISTSCCTGALHLSLLGMGIGPGDEVIVPDVTWVASANAVMYVGATPIFADIDINTWTLDPASFESKITQRTKAVIPVHLYGHPAQMDKIMEIARKHKLLVLEDAAPSIGAEVNGQKAGTFGDVAAFSFQGAKLLVTGEGGMIVTNNDEIYERIYAIWDQGRDPQRTFWINQLGWKYKISNIQAAIGLGQIERAEEQIEAKRRIFSWYQEGLKGLPNIELNHEAPWARSIYWMSSIFLHEDAGITRDEMCAKLKARNIDTRPVFPAISQFPYWPNRQEPQPIAKRVGEQSINLPSGVRLKYEHVAYICRCISEILTGK